MAEYITKEATIKAIENADCAVITYCAESCEADCLREIIESLPTADVAPVVHAKWAHIGGDEFCCTNCGFVISTEGSWEKPTQKHCGECGARMDGGAE